jgi:hypothetical protein
LDTQGVSDILAMPLCKIINSSLAKKKLPCIWKCANVTPIPKNPSITDINNDLRPISLTPTVFKIAEDYVVNEHANQLSFSLWGAINIVVFPIQQPPMSL